MHKDNINKADEIALTSHVKDIEIEALQSCLNNGNLSEDTAGEIISLIRREKERKVLAKHDYKISGPFRTGNRIYYTTRAPWLPSNKLGRSTYNDLIDALYEHYFDYMLREYTVQEIYEIMMRDYESSHIVSYLTLVHYRADWNKYMVKKECAWLHMPINRVLPEQIFQHYRILTAGETMKRSTFGNLRTVVNAVFDYAINLNISCIKASNVSTRRLRFAPAADKWNGVYSTEDKQKILSVCSTTG